MRSDPPDFPDTEEMRPSPITPRLIFGLALIAVGVVFTLQQLDLIDDAWDLLRFWPTLLVVAGLGKLLWPGSSSSRVTGLILIFVGAWLLLEELDIIYFSFWDYWPIVLVLIGIKVAWEGLRGKQAAVASDSSSTVNAVAMLGGADRVSNSQDFRGGDMIAFMGGCDIDLTRARISRPPAVIDAFAFWGGVEIRVPADWNVSMQGIALLGGFADSTAPLSEEVEVEVEGVEPLEPRQELVVKGFAIMGGVEVKN